MSAFKMSPGMRRFSLTLHIIVSVGWLGAVLSYLPLAITCLTSTDADVVLSLPSS